MNKCLHCSNETKNAKFCTRSCSNAYNNRGVCRVEKKIFPHPCADCGKETTSIKYCSMECSANAQRLSKDQLNKANAIRQSRYRAKQYKMLAPDADLKKIKDMYHNCPKGHEVDHIIPLSKGGKHHEDNLQYLTVTENRSKGNRWW